MSKQGIGICHQVHLERFSRPGKTLIGSDSHTPTCGGMGMLAIGAGIVGAMTAERIVDTFLSTSFEGGRHARRVGLMMDTETE